SAPPYSPQTRFPVCLRVTEKPPHSRSGLSGLHQSTLHDPEKPDLPPGASPLSIAEAHPPATMSNTIETDSPTGLIPALLCRGYMHPGSANTFRVTSGGHSVSSRGWLRLR